MLADRDEAAEAGKRIPHRRHDDVDEERGHAIDGAGTSERGHEGQGQEQHDATTDAEPGGGRPAFDLHARCGKVEGIHVAPLRRSRRIGSRARSGNSSRVKRMIRKTACPATRKPSGWSDAPKVCATPRTMPPINVPQSEPAPPITAASKAKSNCGAPAYGSKVARMPRN